MIERVDMNDSFKKRVFEALELSPDDSLLSRSLGLFITVLILINVACVVLETVEDFAVEYTRWFKVVEYFSVIIFTIEYLLRVWTCTEEKRFKRPIRGRMRFILTPLAVVDFIAILPFYLPMFLPLDLRFMRTLRLMRLARLLKMARYSNSLKTLGNVLRAKKEELVVTLFVAGILLIVASSVIYYAEHEAQPKAFNNIPAAMWWGVVTLTTVGYGDVYPITPLGKSFGAVIAMLSIGLVALPTGILASGFAEEIQQKRAKARICPHCGKELGK